MRIILALIAALVLSLGLAKCQGDRAARAEKDRDAWKLVAEVWETSFNAAEQRRKAEQKRAVSAISDEQGRCDARVDAARRSSRTIRQIVTREVPVDAKNCPVRGVVTADDGLRDALQPSR